MEEWDSDLEERLVEMTQSNQEKEKTRNEDSLRNFWNNIKGFLKKQKQKKAENLVEEIRAEKFPKL